MTDDCLLFLRESPQRREQLSPPVVLSIDCGEFTRRSAPESRSQANAEEELPRLFYPFSFLALLPRKIENGVAHLGTDPNVV